MPSLVRSNDKNVLGGAGVGTGAHHRNGGFAAGFRHHILHCTHQKIRREHPAQTGGDDLIARTGLGAALQIGQGAQAVRRIGSIAVQDAVSRVRETTPAALKLGCRMVITLQLVGSASTTMPSR